MALWIAGYWHLFDYTSAFRGYNTYATATITHLFLALFVYISAYLIGARQELHNWRNVAGFYYRRLIRIFPMFLLASLFFVLLGISDAVSAAKGALLCSMLWAPPSGTLWFVVMICNCYLIAPLLLNVSSKPVKFVMLNVALLSVLVLWNGTVTSIDPRMLIYLPVFAAGVYAARHGLHEWIDGQFRRYLIVGCAALLSWPLFPFAFSGMHLTRVVLSVPFLVLTCLLVMGIAKRIKVGDVPRRVFEFLSYVSFSLYLFHRVIYKVSCLAYFPRTHGMQVLYLYSVGLPLCLITAFAAQRASDGMTSRTNALLTTLESSSPP